MHWTPQNLESLEQKLEDELLGLDSKIKTRLLRNLEDRPYLHNEVISKALKVQRRSEAPDEGRTSRERGSIFQSLNPNLKPSATFIEPHLKNASTATPEKPVAQLIGPESEPSLGSFPRIPFNNKSKHPQSTFKMDHWVLDTDPATTAGEPSENPKRKKFNFYSTFAQP